MTLVKKNQIKQNRRNGNLFEWKKN